MVANILVGCVIDHFVYLMRCVFFYVLAVANLLGGCLFDHFVYLMRFFYFCISGCVFDSGWGGMGA